MIVDIIIMLSFNLNLKERRYVDQELDCDCDGEREVQCTFNAGARVRASLWSTSLGEM